MAADLTLQGVAPGLGERGHDGKQDPHRGVLSGFELATMQLRPRSQTMINITTMTLCFCIKLASARTAHET